MNIAIENYNKSLHANEKEICDMLVRIINSELSESESKIWHAHPVWFINGNPVVGYSKQKAGIRLMFWSGADFAEEKLNVLGKKFKDASIIYKSIAEIVKKDVKRWLKKAVEIQWDYKIIKRKGHLERIQ